MSAAQIQKFVGPVLTGDSRPLSDGNGDISSEFVLHGLWASMRFCLHLSFGAFAVDTEESAREGNFRKWQMVVLVWYSVKPERRVQKADTMSIYCRCHEASTGVIRSSCSCQYTERLDE